MGVAGAKVKGCLRGETRESRPAGGGRRREGGERGRGREREREREREK